MQSPQGWGDAPIQNVIIQIVISVTVEPLGVSLGSAFLCKENDIFPRKRAGETALFPFVYAVYIMQFT